MLGPVVIGANTLDAADPSTSFWLDEPRPVVLTGLSERKDGPKFREPSSVNQRRLSQLFPAFVWGTLASTAAWMRHCLDRAVPHLTFALRGARKLVRGLRQELTEEERYRVANDIVLRLKQHGDPWRLSEDLPPPSKWHSVVFSITAQFMHVLANASREIFMNRLLSLGLFLISSTPLYAEGAQPDLAKLKADAQKVVSIISSDKAKTQTYCQISDLGGQIGEANEEQDNKKAEALSRKVSELEKKLGPEYIALISGLKDVDSNSPEGAEISSILEPLDESCPDE
jgi:hypothetical protein